MPLPKLVNGSFEFPRVPVEEGLKFFLDASPPQPGDELEHVPGWMTTATDHMIELWLSGHESVLPYEGRQFAELNANQVSTLYQDCVTEPGMTVQWGLSHRGRTGTDTMALLIGPPDALVKQQEFADGTQWRRYEGSYTIPDGQTLTRFAFKSINLDPKVDPKTLSVGNFLDDIYFGEKHVAPIEIPSIFPEEGIMPARPPLDPKALYTVAHHVTGYYLQTNDPAGPTVNDHVQIWHGELDGYKGGRNWRFEQKSDGSYLISPDERKAGDTRLYLQADPNTSTKVAYTLAYQKPRAADGSKEDELQSWLMQPVSGDVATYAIVPKMFQDHALGGGWYSEPGDVVAAVRHTLGGPTLFYYWRLGPALA